MEKMRKDVLVLSESNKYTIPFIADIIVKNQNAFVQSYFPVTQNWLFSVPPTTYGAK